jgi:hypothetical protein
MLKDLPFLIALFYSNLYPFYFSPKGKGKSGVGPLMSCLPTQRTSCAHLQMPNFLAYICLTKGGSKIIFCSRPKQLTFSTNIY